MGRGGAPGAARSPALPRPPRPRMARGFVVRARCRRGDALSHPGIGDRLLSHHLSRQARRRRMRGDRDRTHRSRKRRGALDRADHHGNGRCAGAAAHGNGAAVICVRMARSGVATGRDRFDHCACVRIHTEPRRFRPGGRDRHARTALCLADVLRADGDDGGVQHGVRHPTAPADARDGRPPSPRGGRGLRSRGRRCEDAGTRGRPRRRQRVARQANAACPDLPYRPDRDGEVPARRGDDVVSADARRRGAAGAAGVRRGVPGGGRGNRGGRGAPPARPRRRRPARAPPAAGRNSGPLPRRLVARSQDSRSRTAAPTTFRPSPRSSSAMR